MAFFNKGYEAQREEKARQDEARENMGKKLWRFFLPQPEKNQTSVEADVRFLTEEPINFYEHNIKSTRNGKEVFKQYTCTQDSNCPFCDDGDKPSFKGAFLIIDRREYEYTDKDGKKQHGRDQVRLFVQGARVVSQLDRISSKYGLSNREVTIVRLGKGTETTYTIEKGDKEKLSSKEIENLLPEKLRDDYDGTQDSLYEIVKEQLLMNTKDYDGSSDYEEEEEDDSDSGVIGVEDEEEELPFRSKKPSGLRKSSGTKKKIFKSKAENSLKPHGNERAKKLLNK